MACSSPLSRPLLLFAAVVISLVFVSHLALSDRPIHRIIQFRAGSSNQASPIYNATLGFEKVFTINMASRSDKRDAMALAASLTVIDMSYIDGVPGEAVPDKALPYKQEDRHISNSFIGSWRAHMNAIRGIIENRLSTALLLEDDMDWDIRIRSQLAALAPAIRSLQNTTSSNQQTHSSPYGNDWDVLWLGHCQDHVDNSSRFTEIENDVTAPDWHRIEQAFPDRVIPDWAKTRPPHTRFVHAAGSQLCSYAYAVSYRGAQKLLWGLSVKELTAEFDNALREWCRDGRGKCISVWPTVFWAHHSRGAAGKNSDNTGSDGEQASSTEMLQWPTKMNVEKLLKGATDFEDQYKDVVQENEGPGSMVLA